MKKVCLKVLILLLIIVCIVTVGGCNKKAKYQEYFNDFSSVGAFSAATQTLSLPQNVSIFSYDSKNDVYVTRTEVLNQYGSLQDETMFLLGFASVNEVYCTPKYTGVLKIKGDYAIVTKPALGKDSENNSILVHNVGVIKFRNTGTGNTKDLTDFSVEHNESYDQFSFVGDYIACPGTKNAPYAALTFSTFYDYSQGVLLEKFKVKCGGKYTFTLNDGILAAVASNHAYFYEISSLQLNGYLEINEKDFYYAFPEDTQEEYIDKISISIFYLGNGWFSRTAKIQDETAFTGYNMILQDYDTYSGETTTYYANVRCDFYNVKTKTTTQREWLFVEGVANKYNSDYFIELCNYLQNLSPYDNNSGRYSYSLPYLNPAMSIKDDYSIVYYYYLPYIDRGSYQAEISFCLLDRQANIIRIEDLLMPPVYIDGAAVQTSDPIYQNYFGSCSVYDKNFKERVLEPVATDAYTYITYAINSGGVVANQINIQTEQSFYGALSLDGRRLLPFIYEELSLYYGDYCIGTKKSGSAYITSRIDKSGTETLLSDVVNVRQGVYVFSKNDKLGLKNYEGKILIEANYDNLDVVETIMENGKFLTSRVVASDGDNTTLFILE